jgi:hypothetical protein
MAKKYIGIALDIDLKSNDKVKIKVKKIKNS